MPVESKPGQDRSDTLSYDHPAASGGPVNPAPAARPENRATAVMPADLAPHGPFTDPLAVGPAPQAPLAITPLAPAAIDPVVDKAPGAFRAGDVIDHFEIVGLVGQGGMGCVYKAFDRELGRTVAIKTLHGIEQQTPQALARFKREAQAASRVVHPNLVIIYSSGSFDNTPYIVMEYLSGRSLAAEIAEGPLTIARTADTLGAACAGVYAAHRAGVVHRDLKPANVFLARTPMGETPKILDFGISRIGDDNSSLTGTGDIVGTTYYLAPEQASGKPIDARVDQYALGVILYECLTGVRPFTGDAVYTIMRNIVEGVFQPPSQLCPDIPRELESVVLRAMSRAPDDRFARVRDLGLALVPFMSVPGRQKWAHHFTAPEADMPVAHSLALPGAAGPVPITPALPPAPTKIIPTPGQEMPTRTLQPADKDGLEAAPEAFAKRPGRRGVLVLTAAVIAVLGLAAAWILGRPESRPQVRASAPESPAAQPMPTPAQPTAPSAEVPSPAVIPPAEPADERGREPRKRPTTKQGRSKESADPAESGSKSGDPLKPLKHGMW